MATGPTGPQLIQQAEGGGLSPQDSAQLQARQGQAGPPPPVQAPALGEEQPDLLGGIEARIAARQAQQQALQQQQLAAEQAVDPEFQRPPSLAPGQVARTAIRGMGLGLADMGQAGATLVDIGTLGTSARRRGTWAWDPINTEQFINSVPGLQKQQGKAAEIIEDVARSVPFTLMAVGTVRGLAQAGRTAETMPRSAFITRAMLRDLEKLGAAKLAILETLMATVGATGGVGFTQVMKTLKDTAGIDVVPEWSQKLIGSLIATYGAGTFFNMIQAARANRSNRTPARTIRGATKKVSRIFARQAPTDAPFFDDQLRETLEIQQQIPGLSFDVATSTRRPGMTQVTKTINQQFPEAAEFAVQKTSENSVALRNGLWNARRSFDDVNDPNLLVQKVQQHFDELDRQFDQDMAGALAPVNQLTDDLGITPTTNTKDMLQDRAMDLRVEMQGAERQLDLLGNEMFQNIEVKVGKLPIFEQGGMLNTWLKEQKKFAATPERLRTKLNDFKQRSLAIRNWLKEPKVEAGIADAITGKPVKIRGTYAELRAIVQDVNADLIALSQKATRVGKEAGDDQLIGALNFLKQQAEAQLDRIAPGGNLAFKVPREVSQDYGVARSIFRRAAADVKDVLRTAQEKAAKTSLTQRDTAVRTASLFLRDRKNMQSYLRVFGGFAEEADPRFGQFSNQRAVDQMTEYAMVNFYDSVVRDGRVVDPKLVRKWLEQNPGVLELPGMAERFRTIGDAEGLARQVEVQFNKGMKSHENQILRLFLEGRDPDTVMNDLLSGNSPDRVKDVRVMWDKVKGDPDAAKQFRQMMWKHMTSRFETQLKGIPEIPMLDPEAMRTYLGAYGAFLQEIYDPDTLQKLHVLQRASERVLRQAEGLPQVSGGIQLDEEMKALTANIRFLVNRGFLFGKKPLTPNRLFSTGEATTRRILDTYAQVNREVMVHAVMNAMWDPQALNLLIDTGRKSAKLMRVRWAGYAQQHAAVIEESANKMREATQELATQQGFIFDPNEAREQRPDAATELLVQPQEQRNRTILQPGGTARELNRPSPVRLGP